MAEFCREHGIVFVADEIQAGIARTGAWFASEHEGLVPDLLCTAKALGGGLPISAVTGRAEIMDSVAAGGLGGTFAGNPVACAAALGALATIEREGLVERAREIESPREASAARARRRRPRDRRRARTRGHARPRAGAPGTKDPDATAAAQVAARCHAQGVLVLVCGTYSNVIRLLPPLVIDFDLLDDALDVLDDAIRSLS